MPSNSLRFLPIARRALISACSSALVCQRDVDYDISARYFVGVGAPGANGVVLCASEDQYFSSQSQNSMFEIKSTQFLQGFRLSLITIQVMQYHGIFTAKNVHWGPKADNYDQYRGRITRYGADGRLYVVTICQPNRYRYSANQYSYIKTCVDCDGTYSLGGYVVSAPLATQNFQNPSSCWDGASRGCFARASNYFGSACKTCRHICFPMRIHHCILSGDRSMVYAPLNATMIMT